MEDNNRTSHDSESEVEQGTSSDFNFIYCIDNPSHVDIESIDCLVSPQINTALGCPFTSHDIHHVLFQMNRVKC